MTFTKVFTIVKFTIDNCQIVFFKAFFSEFILADPSFLGEVKSNEILLELIDELKPEVSSLMGKK